MEKSILVTLALGAFLLASPSLYAEVVSQNAYVTIRALSDDVKSIKRIGNDFHVWPNELNRGFTSGIEITANPGWRLVSPSSLNGTVFSPQRYRVESIASLEEQSTKTVSGEICLAYVDFTLSSIDGVFGNGVLTDNRPGRAIITLGGIHSLVGYDVNWSSSPQPPHAGTVVNKSGTGITFHVLEGTDQLIWETSPIYWYGIVPDYCCHFLSFPYLFTLRVDQTLCQIGKSLEVSMPGDESFFEALPISSNGYSTAELMPDGRYRSELIIRDFIKDGRFEFSTKNHQFENDAINEERFHALQWKGMVPLSEGGAGDCYTRKGQLWFLARLHPNITGGYVYGETADEAEQNARDILREITEQEAIQSGIIWENNRGYVELKAKEHVGYVAAWKYHCTYLRRFGANPVRRTHPAYQDD